MSWLAWALIAAVFWGVGPIFAKLGLEKPDALTALLIRSVAVVAVLVVWALFRGDFRGSIAQVNGRTPGPTSPGRGIPLRCLPISPISRHLRKAV
ncbi:MAG: EamA family transporter [Bacillota bacterium]